MGEKCNTITLYASQADPVIEAIERVQRFSQQPIPGLCVRWRNM